MKLLQLINWKMKNFHLEVIFLNFYLNEEYAKWGFDLLNISFKNKIGSLCCFIFYLPNGANRTSFCWNGDLFFLKNILLNQLDSLEDLIIWNAKSFTVFQSVKYKVLKFILD